MLFLIFKTVNAFYVAVQHLWYDAVYSLQQGLERAYTILHVPCPVSVACVSGMAETSVR